MIPRESENFARSAKPRFDTTCWSTIRRAGAVEGEDARLALGKMIETYWYPLYAFARRRDRTACRAALELKPEYPEALNNLGLSLHEMGKHDEALTHLDTALKFKPHFAMAMNNRGSALRELKQTKEAIEAYRKAVELDPKLAKSHANLGQLLADDRHLIEGLANCRKAVKHQPDLAAAHNNLGNLLRELERWDEAGEAYAEAVRLQPDLAIAHANLALMYRRVNRPGLAVTNAIATQLYTVEIASVIGSSTAYFGFTGATAAAYAGQFISSWTVYL